MVRRSLVRVTLALGVLALSAGAWAAEIRGLQARRTKTLHGGFQLLAEPLDDVITAVRHHGVQFRLLILLELYESDARWYVADRRLLAEGYELRLSYQHWRERYEIAGERLEAGGRVKWSGLFAEALTVRKTLTDHEFHLQWKTLAAVPAGPLQLRAKATSESVRLFGPISWITRLISLYDFDTPWAEITL